MILGVCLNFLKVHFTFKYINPGKKLTPAGDVAQVWFKNQPLGVHSLGNMMKTMAELAELPGRKTNHSGRKTTVKRLKEANFDNVDIIQLTGHKNVQSLNLYSTVPVKIQKKMSEALTSSTVSEQIDFPEIPAKEMAEILQSIDHCEQLQPTASTTINPVNMPVASQDIQMSHKQILNSSSGMGTPLFAGANISGGNITVNINYKTQ